MTLFIMIYSVDSDLYIVNHVVFLFLVVEGLLVDIRSQAEGLIGDVNSGIGDMVGQFSLQSGQWYMFLSYIGHTGILGIENEVINMFHSVKFTQATKN